MQVWNVLHAARWKYRTTKISKKSPSGHHRITSSRYIFANKARIDNRKKNLLNSNVSLTCPYNTVNFGPLAVEIYWWVWSTPANFSRFRVLAASLHGTLLEGVSQTVRRWTEGATYIGQRGYHVGHWPTFLVSVVIFQLQFKLQSYFLSFSFSYYFSYYFSYLIFQLQLQLFWTSINFTENKQNAAFNWHRAT